jgi:PAS domain S-box-containing protein
MAGRGDDPEHGQPTSARDAPFRLVVDAIADYAIFMLDLDGRVTSWNAGARALKGYSSEEILGQHFSVFYPPEDRARDKPRRELEIAAKDGRLEDEGWRVRKDGSLFMASVVITPVRDAAGQLIGYAKVTRDLTERRAAEQRSQLIEASPDGILLVDGTGRILNANSRAAALFGYARDELVGRIHDDLVPERVRAVHRAHRAGYTAAPTSRPMGAAGVPMNGLRKDGTELAVEISLAPLDGREGPLFAAFIRDVTELRRLEQHEARIADRVTRLQWATSALGRAVDVGSVVAEIIRSCVEAVGATGGLVAQMVEDGRALEMVGETGRTPEQVERSVPSMEAAGFRVHGASGGRRCSIDACNPLADAARTREGIWLEDLAEIHLHYPGLASLFGDTPWRSVVVLPLVSRDNVLGVLRLGFAEARSFDDEERAFLRSLAEQCALAFDRATLYEEAVDARDRAERAAMMRDEFLSVVAHDLGNPMNAIGLWARSLLDRAPAGAEGDTAREGATRIQESVRGMALLLQDLEDVASIDAGHLRLRMQERDAATIVNAVVEGFRPLCVEKGVSIEARATSVRLACDPNRAEQALGNLVANAIKFTPAGGAIVVEAAPSGDRVRFTVSDTGPGIATEDRDRVFERRWRSRDGDHTRGVGLGLFIAKSLVEAHGGAIGVDSAIGRGSTFFFTLPGGAPQG